MTVTLPVDVNEISLQQYLNEGNRLARPSYIPHELFQLCELCWWQEAARRPVWHHCS